MARIAGTEIIGWVAIVFGPMLIMGALMFSMVALLAPAPAMPRILLIPPLVQVALGLLCSAAGELLRRGGRLAKPLLIFVGISLAANMVFLLILFVATR